ncbi:Pentatricopeptide repeat [Macleaya cordata]|uniref:Pentatricopeptide repeat n=1 Tax=Macleaya cordata TaxID=56857 RepID=A0A200QZS8_MACCD|nr:Pentatricopeptide repeat [Macleaya cordata]
MAAVSSVPISVPLPAIHQLPPNDHFRPPFLPIQSHKSDLRSSCTQVQAEESSTLMVELQNNGFSDSPINTFTYNNLLSSTVKNGRLEDAHKLFDEMPNRNEVSWSTIISAYTRSGNYMKAFGLLEEMWKEGLRPNEFALGSLLKASSGLRDICIGKQLHGWLIRTGFGLDAGVQTSLITMYSNCGYLSDARRVFDGIPNSSLNDGPLWNSVIAAYIFHECWIEAFQLFSSMISTGFVAPTKFSYASVINSCSNTRAEKYGKIIHGMVIKDGTFDETMMGNSLITFYAKCGILEDANRVFERISSKSVVSWNSIIAGNEQNGEGKAAINLFHRMLRLGHSVQPNRITFLSVLSAVSGVSALNSGKEIHACMIKSGLEFETTIANSLITMYSKCREVGKAGLVFERLPFKDMVTWNSMLTGFEQNEQWEKCLELFKEMLLLGIKPDDHSFTVILSAASSLPSELKYLRTGRAIHGYILRRADPQGVGISTSNAILTMYAKSNRVEGAEKIFKGMSEKDSYSWNAMMDGYSINGRSEDSILIFLDKHEQNLSSDYLTFSILLTACSRLVSFDLGKQFHAFIVKNINRRGHINQNYLLSINNSLVSMYSKCGSISDAAQVFSRMRRRDVFSWTAMITGYAQHGMAYESLELFDRMKQDNVKPNSITFLGLLTACAHAGLVEEGLHYFSSMNRDHDLNPSIEHYACMVDLFGRAGKLERAMEFIESGFTQFNPVKGECLSLWRVLLGACHAHKQLELGVNAAMKILELEPGDETTHILLSNLYAAKGMWEDAIRVRKLMREKGLKKKEIGCSWIEAENRRHLFVAGDVSHPQRKEIYMKLEEVDGKCRKTGYVPMTEYVLHDVDELQKEAIVGCHSEKLAVSFGLLQNGTGNKGVIRVIKNLRICGDCHNWMKFASTVERREIVLRDSRRFHFFKDGKCSCRDYW